MREVSGPSTTGAAEPAGTGLAEMIWTRARSHPDRAMISYPYRGGWRTLSAVEVASRVRAAAKGLIAAGLEPGERLAILAETRSDWPIIEYAAWAVGICTVSLYDTWAVNQVDAVLRDSDPCALILDGDHRRDVVGSRWWGQFEQAGRLWRMDPGGTAGSDADGPVDVAMLGRAVSDAALDDRLRQVHLGDVATLVYTAGTTGQPKACVLTHRNLLAASRALRHAGPRRFAEGGALLMFLPLTHIFGRTVQCAAIEAGMNVGYMPDVRRLPDHLRSFRPSLLLGVPAVFHGIKNSLVEGFRPLRPLTAAAYRVAVQSAGGGDRRRSARLRLTHRLLDATVYRVVRKRLGGRCVGAVCGGGPLEPDLGRYFEGIGIPILEGYGLTESSGGAVGNTESATRPGTVGRPLTGVTVRIDDRDRIWLRGDTVFQGYWRNAEATAAVLRDGWLLTGDTGRFDQDGFLVLTGNTKSMFVTTAAENVAYTEIEARLLRHPDIEHGIVLGHALPFATALVTLDHGGRLWGMLSTEEKLGWNSGSDLPDAVERELKAIVDDANTAVTTAHGVRRFRVLPRGLSSDNGEIGTDGRPDRDVVVEHFRDYLDSMYPEDFRA